MRAPPSRVQRARGLGPAELDWLPPDGGWPLRRVLHHVAGSELLYARSLDDALPDDPRAAYAEACRRLDERVCALPASGDDPSTVYASLYGVARTPVQVVQEVLTIEAELQGGPVGPGPGRR